MDQSERCLRADGAFSGALSTAGEEAGPAETADWGAMWSQENRHDPFLPLTLGAEHTSDLQLGTAIVGEAMTPVVAEVADGMLVHAFTTPQFLEK